MVRPYQTWRLPRPTATLFIVCLGACGGEEIPLTERPIKDALIDMGVFELQEINDTVLPGYRVFDFMVNQPVDHDNPDGPTFRQRVVLSYRSKDAPTVLATNGYSLQYSGTTTIFGVVRYPYVVLLEPAARFAANQIEVEHRFYGSSPAPRGVLDFEHLTIKQSARDLHRIVQMFKPLLTKPWLSTGVSKGGKTALIHRSYYPDDVDATVAYVSAATFELGDQRYADFLDRIGSEVCRNTVEAMQIAILERRDTLNARVADYLSDNYNISLSSEEIDVQLEASALTLSFQFWQYFGRDACNDIPAPTASPWRIIEFIDKIDGLSTWAPESRAPFAPYRHQVRTELGTPAVPVDHLAGLLKYWAPLTEEDRALHDPSAMRAVADWVATQADQTLLIYGEDDPWTAGAFTVADRPDNDFLVIPGGTHSADLTQAEKDTENAALQRVAGWISTPIDTAMTQKGRKEDWKQQRRRFRVPGWTILHLRADF